MRQTTVLVILCLFIAPFSGVFAQSPPTYLNDQVLGGTGGKFEKIVLMNGGVNLTIPVLSVKGRGINFTYTVNYSSKIWYPEQAAFPPFSNFWRFRQPWGVNGSSAGGTAATMVVDTCETLAGPQEIWASTNLSQGFKDGSAKQFPTAEITMPDCMQPIPYANYLQTYSSDLSSIYYAPYVAFKAPDGSVPDSADANGNYLGGSCTGSSCTFIDSVGRAVLTDNGGFPNQQLTLSDGRVITLIWSAISMTTSFPTGVNCSNCQVYVLTRINLPNGRFWAFEYANNSFGQLTKVILPSGGYIRYVYSLLSTYNVDGYPTHAVVSRFESPDGISENQNSYSYATITDGNQVTQTDPDGDVTITTFKPFDGLYETDVEHRQGASQPLQKIHKDWACDLIPKSIYATTGNVSVEVSAGNCRLTDETTTIYDGATAKTKKIHYNYDASLNHFHPGNIYPFGGNDNYTTTYGNVTGVLEYDWGPGTTPGALVRQTELTYLSTNPANGDVDYRQTGIHIVNKVASKIVKDAAGCAKSQTLFEYDGSALTTTSGVPQHNYQTHPFSNRNRGNLTKVKAWKNSSGSCTAGTWLETTNAFDDLGNLRTSTDPGGHTTNFSYADAYSDGIPRNSQAYLTQITYPPTSGIAHVEKKGYYYHTGLVYEEVDQNNQPTRFTYDNMNRLVSVVHPNSGQVSFAFNDPAYPPKVTTTTKINAGVNLVTETELDGFGRTRKTKLFDPQGNTFTRIQYDASGRKQLEWNPTRCDPDTNPVSCSGEPSFGRTEYVYDGLDRITKLIPPDGTVSTNHVVTAYTLESSTNAAITTVTDQVGKQRRSYTDALGRLLRADEPYPTLASPAVTTYGYDVLDNLTTVLQSGSRPRSFVYNSLAQLLTTTNPESGTTNYAYDNDGNLLTKIDARNITTTYLYDSCTASRTRFTVTAPRWRRTPTTWLRCMAHLSATRWAGWWLPRSPTRSA
jgi:YD repeat-containing protein